MEPRRRIAAVPLLAAALLLLPAASGPAAATHISIDLGHEDITFDDEDVIIEARDGSRARVSPEGDLTIRGRRVSVGAAERRALRNYNESMHWMVEQAVEIGVDSAGLAFSALGHALAAIATGDGDRAERRVEARAEPIKEKARELCREVRALVLVQESIASRVPAFRPYAVLDEDAGDDCHVDD
jgi:hypothetical protein